jgi:hypothetical protein
MTPARERKLRLRKNSEFGYLATADEDEVYWRSQISDA